MVRRTAALGDAVALAVVVGVAACSSHGDGTGNQGPNTGHELGTVGISTPNGMGAVGLALTIGNGVHVNQLSWTLSNGANSYSGVVAITDDAGHEAQSVEFVAGGILAGSGYVVTLYGADSNGDPCTGTSAAITVTAGATSNSTILVTCTSPTDATTPADVDNGSIAVTAPVVLATQAPFQCPGITAVSISPAEVMPPETATLTAQETGSDGGTPTLLWTSTCGTITNPTSATATFSCGTTTGTCTVTLTVGLDGTGVDGGNVGQVCTGLANTTASESIVCEPQCSVASDCPAEPTACLVPACVSSRCIVNNAPQGTACTDSGGSICNGGGTCVVPSFDVVRIGTGADAGAGLTVPVFIDQYNLTGGLVSTIALPTSAGPAGSNQALTLIDNDVNEGDLTTSTDGRFVVMAGHNYAPGVTISAGSCVAAFINSSGTVNTTMTLPDALAAGGSVHSAGSNDGAEVWVGGTASDTTGGLWYEAAGMSDVQIVSATTATRTARWLRIAGGQLYGDSHGTAAANGLFTVGTGEPTSGTPAPTLALLSGLPSGSTVSPYGFVFFDLNPAVPGLDTLYVADDRTTSGGGLGKFTASVGDGGTLTWAASWTIGGNGIRGLAGYATGNTVTLMASTGKGGDAPDSLVVLVDTGTGTPSPSVVATSLTNEVFRGVAVPPHP